MKQLNKRSKRLFVFFSILVLVFSVQFTALAASDPLAVVNNLSDFIFSIIRAVGLILLGFGILQLGLSFKSHDASQRSNAMLTVLGGDCHHLCEGDFNLGDGLMRREKGDKKGGITWALETGSWII